MAQERHKFISAVHLLLSRDGKYLLSRRFNTGYEDGNYSLVAGHIDEDERALNAMVREAQEEVGIEIEEKHLKMVHVMQRRDSSFRNGRIDFFFEATTWCGEPTIREPEKCDDLSWFDVDKLPKIMVPYVRFALEKVEEGVSYSEFGW